MDTAVRRATATAGRTVAFSGLAVAISFAGLAFFPSRFLSSMGYAAVAVVAFAVIGSLTLLPALLRYTGHRIDTWRVPLPATMALLGTWAWWAPAPLARWWSRHGLREPAAEERTVPAPAGAAQGGRAAPGDFRCGGRD